MLTAFDVLLIAAAVFVMLVGISDKVSLLREAGNSQGLKKDWVGLAKYLVRQDPILKRSFVGFCHLFLSWGCFVFLLISILAQFNITIAASPARVLSAILEWLGILMLVGAYCFLVRGCINRPEDSTSHGTVFSMAVMMIILVTGFMARGARLTIIGQELSWVHPLGSLLSSVLPASPLFMQAMIRIHFLAVLLFIALLPFTSMRHLVFASANVLYRRRTRRGELVPVALDSSTYGAGTVLDFSWKQLLDANACVSCGRCEENCPAYLSGKALSPRKIMGAIFKQMSAAGKIKGNNGPLPLLESDISPDELWACTTCMACVQHCPVFAEPLDEIIDMRRHRVMELGFLPVEARAVLRDLKLYGDVHGKGATRRTEWAPKREVPVVSDKAFNSELLLWVGCSGAFHPRNQDTARAMVRILNAAGVNYAILGSKERCCGDPARRLGDEALFLDLARENVRLFNRFGVKKIVTLCPHCLHALKNEYPAIGGNYEVVHASECVEELISRGRIHIKYSNRKKIAVQDPCYLGRCNGIYEPLRMICKVVPGIEMMEMDRNRENSFCCGGGGGRMWLHETEGVGINKARAEEASRTGVDLVGTACPFCLTMLEDGIKSIEAENHPKVVDVIEIVADAIELRPKVEDPEEE